MSVTNVDLKVGLSNTDKTNMANQITAETLNKLIPTFSTSVVYTKGQYTIYSNALYRFTANKSAGEWDNTKVESATLEDLIDDVNEAVASVDDKASIDGYYAGMSVGYADNLTPYSDESGNEQTIPFVMQGTGCGNGENIIDTGSFAQLKEKRGNSVVVNQHVQNSNFESTSNWSADSATFSVASNELTFTATAQYGLVKTSVNLINGHKYLYCVDIKCDTTDIYFSLSGVGVIQPISSANYQKLISIFSWSAATGSWDFRVSDRRASGWTAITLKKAMCIDLTQWFSSNDNIPSYLLSHPEDFGKYYSGSLAYNAGTIVNSNGRYLKTIGRNLWDEEWEQGDINWQTGATASSATIRSKNFIKVIPNTQYYFKHPYSNVEEGENYWKIVWYDSNYNYISGDSTKNIYIKTAPQNACYLKFSSSINYGTTYNNDITISIYYEGESGYNEYYSYEELENVDTGTEVLRSAGSAYDVKKPSGEITRNVVRVDLGSLDWYINSNNGLFMANQITNIANFKNDNNFPNLLSDKLSIQKNVWGNDTNAGSTYPDLSVFGWRTLKVVIVKYTATTDVAVFKQAMSGVYLYYELATPTTEQGTPFQENIKIDDFGSMMWNNESFNDVPQGNAIFYPVNYKGFIDSLNNYTEGDASKIVLEENINTYNYNISNIVDTNGNKRFVEGDINIGQDATTAGLVKTYGKWSLSGTHFMVVLCIEIPANVEYSGGYLSYTTLPSYINDKIQPVISSGAEFLDVKAFDLYVDGSYGRPTDSVVVLFRKWGTSQVVLQTNSTIVSSSSKRAFRIQFDLLIDTD